MPLARIADKLLFFAHIPKTGGSSVEAYLDAKGPVQRCAQGCRATGPTPRAPRACPNMRPGARPSLKTGTLPARSGIVPTGSSGGARMGLQAASEPRVSRHGVATPNFVITHFML